MSNILVTGGLGFIGSNLVDTLVLSNPDDKIYVIDDLSLGDLDFKNTSSNVTYIRKDIRDMFTKGIDRLPNNMETIYHLAAMSRVNPSFDDPVKCVDINVNGTSIICEYARRSGATVVYAGSSSFYGGTYLNPYSFTKWNGEEICKMYHEIFDVPVSIARFFNVFGNRQPSDGPYAIVLGIFQRQYANNEPLTITGTGEQERDFISVNDICRGLTAIAEKGTGEIWNIGSGSKYSINEIAGMFNCETEYIPMRPGEADSTLADISKIMSETDWKPVDKVDDYIYDFISKYTFDKKVISA